MIDPPDTMPSPLPLLPFLLPSFAFTFLSLFLSEGGGVIGERKPPLGDPPPASAFYCPNREISSQVFRLRPLCLLKSESNETKRRLMCGSCYVLYFTCGGCKGEGG